ncbi:hypothetical protein VTG60DRAFT_2949 [Thermothelomyces hinnuleus]
MGKLATGLLDPKWKLRDHILVLALAVLVIVLTGVYIGTSPFFTRPDIMAISFAVKTLIIATYQLLSEHAQRFAKWRSLKANLILNFIEPVFWLTLVILKFMGIATFCSGNSCAVAWLITLTAIVILVLSLHPPKTAPTPASSQGGREQGEPVESSTPATATLQPPRDEGINIMDLELMHNFTTYTCTTLVSDPAVRQFLRTTAVHMAVNCEYIMRSILAVSALHLSRYRPRNRETYLERAMQHHQAATSAALELMADLRAEECERLHIFSMLTVYYALGCPVNEDDVAPERPLIPHWLRLLHGMEPILRMLEPRTYRGVLTPLFDFGRRRMAPFLKTTPSRDPDLLGGVQALIHRTCADPRLVPVYDDMIEQLRRMLGLLLPPSSGRDMSDSHTAWLHSYQGNGREGPDGSPSPGGATPSVSARAAAAPAEAAASAVPPAWSKLEAWDILVWQWTQGKDFLPLLESASPPQEAVVIFAYCLLVLKKLENQWWLEGWADHLMGKTWALLDEEHRHWVVWVTEQMGWIPPR